MKKLWLSLLLFVASPLLAKGTEKEFHLSDFHCGVDTYHSSLTLPDCFVQDALNVYFDKVSGASKRSGYTVFASTKSYAFTGLWSFTDSSSNVWMIARSSDSIVATTGVGTSKFSVKIATVSANDIVSEANAFGKANFVDPTQGVYTWDGSVMLAISGSPKGTLITAFHNRLWVGGKASPNQNIIDGSKFQDGTTWTLGPNANDPVEYPVGLQDNFDKITAFFPGYNDTLYIFKNYSISSLIGFDQTDFGIHTMTLETGCIDQGSLQPFIGGLVFASPRGIEYYDGYTATRISDPVKNKVDPVTVNSSFNQTSWTQSTQADWQAGSFNQPTDFSTTISVNNLVLSTFTHTDSVAADWSAGTLSSLVASGNSIKLASSDGNINNNGFESGSANWTLGNGTVSGAVSGVNCTLSPRTGSGMLLNTIVNPGFQETYTAYLKGCNSGSVVGQVSWNQVNNSCAWTSRTLSESAASGLSVKIQIDDASIPITVATSDCFLADGTNITFWTASDVVRNGVPTLDSVVIDDITSGRNTISSGTFTSLPFNTGIPNLTILPTAGWTANSLIPSFVLQGSNNGSSWSDLTTSTGVTLTSSKKWMRYLSTFTWTTAVDANSTLDSVTLTAEASSGVFTTQSHNITGITSFGNLSVTQDLSTGGTLAFSVCTAATSNMTGAVCNVIAANSQITTPINNFADIIATYSVVSTTNIPALSNTNIQWFSGTKKPPMASAVFDNRYWLSITTDTSDAQNDATLVLAKGPVWTIFDIKAGAFTLWKNALYHGDALGTGNVYLDNQGFSDNSAAINAYITTKDYSPESIIYDKFFDSLYLIADNLGNYNIYPSYQIDKSGTFFPLGNPVQNELLGEMISKLPFPIDAAHQVFGKTISFKFQQNDLNAPMQIFGGILLYKWRPPQ